MADPPLPDTERIVLHLDMDCFYAACEHLRETEPEATRRTRRVTRDA